MSVRDDVIEIFEDRLENLPCVRSLQGILHIRPVSFLLGVHIPGLLSIEMAGVNVPHCISELIEIIEQIMCFLVEKGSHESKEFSFEIIKVVELMRRAIKIHPSAVCIPGRSVRPSVIYNDCGRLSRSVSHRNSKTAEVALEFFAHQHIPGSQFTLLIQCEFSHLCSYCRVKAHNLTPPS